MEINPIYAGNRINPLNRFDFFDHRDIIKKIYEKSRESYRIVTINLVRPKKLSRYIARKNYQDFMKNIDNQLDELRKKIFPQGNYLTIGNLVNIIG